MYKRLSIPTVEADPLPPRARKPRIHLPLRSLDARWGKIAQIVYPAPLARKGER